MHVPKYNFQGVDVHVPKNNWQNADMHVPKYNLNKKTATKTKTKESRRELDAISYNFNDTVLWTQLCCPYSFRLECNLENVRITFLKGL